MKEKILAIHKLQICLQRSQNLEFLLRFNGDENNADLCQKKNIKLKNQIDDLIQEAMNTWLLNANKDIEKINISNLKLKKAINDIENNINVANNIVEAIGHIDDVIKIATKLL